MNRRLFILFILAQSLVCDCGNIVRAQEIVPPIVPSDSTVLNDSASHNASITQDSVVVASVVTSDCEVAETDEQQKELIAYVVLGVCLLVSLLSLFYAYRARRKVGKLTKYIQNELGQSETLSEKSSENTLSNVTKNQWNEFSKKVKDHDKLLKELQKEISRLNSDLKELQRKIPKGGAASVDGGKTSKKHVDKKTMQQEAVNRDTKKQIPRPTSDSEYKYLKVVDGGRLTLSQTSDNSYYRAWMFNGILYYEFHSAKVGKAINNRTSIIEPFCDISDGTIDPDTATNVETTNLGELGPDFTINKKATILYN